MANNPRPTSTNRLNGPPAPSDKHEGNKEKSDFKKPTFWVGILTLLVVSAYTFFARQQVTETQTANTIAKKALAEANKPYVMFSGLFPNHTTDTNGDHLRIGFALTNFGNTPASFVRFTNCDPIIMQGGAAPNLHCLASEKTSDPAEIGPKQTANYSGPIIRAV
jgi:hypothetical protein